MLATLIGNQNQLKKIRLQGKFPATSSCDALMVALADLVSKPSVNELNLVGEEGSAVNLGPFLHLMVSYLFSPATNEQRLILHGFKFRKGMTRSRLPLDQYSVTEGENRKTLDLSGMDMFPLIPQLLQVPPVVLKCVELSSIHSSTSPSEKHSCLPNITAKNVVVQFEGKCDPEVNGTVTSLILNSSIECLCVSSYYYPIPNSYLSSLGRVIAKHAELFHTLKSITFCNSRDADDPKFDDCTLCDSLISLGQAVPLELKFQNMVSSIQMLHKIWKEKNLSQKFRKLVILKYSGYEKDIVNYQEMADSIQGVTELLY